MLGLFLTQVLLLILHTPLVVDQPPLKVGLRLRFSSSLSSGPSSESAFNRFFTFP